MGRIRKRASVLTKNARSVQFLWKKWYGWQFVDDRLNLPAVLHLTTDRISMLALQSAIGAMRIFVEDHVYKCYNLKNKKLLRLLC